MLCLQAAILTGRRSKTAVSLAEVDDSVDRIVAGMEGTPMVDSKSKSLVAYHEVGHAVCGTLTPGKSQPCLLLPLPKCSQSSGLLAYAVHLLSLFDVILDQGSAWTAAATMP